MPPPLNFYAIKSLLRWRVNYFTSIKIDSVKISIPVINGVGRAHLDYTPDHIYSIIKKLSQNHRYLVDIGANIGQTFVKWLAICGADCDYVGFDCNTQCASYCDLLISANKMSKAHVFPVGLGGELLLMPLLLASSSNGTDPGASTNYLIRDSSFYSSWRQALIVPAYIFQLLVLPSNPIIKIDIEGSEAVVIEALLALNAINSPIFIIEILPPCQGFGPAANDAWVENKRKIFLMMQDAGYEGRNISHIGWHGESSGESPDYLFFRGDLSADVLEMLN